MTNIILLIVAVILIGFLVMIKVARNKIKNTPMVADHQKILTLTDKNFNQQTKNKVVLVDFWASWCAPCRIMAPVLNDVAEELDGNKRIGKVNIEQFQGMTKKFKVRNIPTLLLFKNGVEVKRFVGIKSKDFLMKEIAKAE